MILFNIIRKALMAGFGVQERVKEFIDELVKKGELSEIQGAKLLREWMDKAEDTRKEINKSLSELVAKTLEVMHLPTRDEIERIDKKVQSLSARVKKIEKGGGTEE